MPPRREDEGDCNDVNFQWICDIVDEHRIRLRALLSGVPPPIA
jgi:hypothetical protein